MLSDDKFPLIKENQTLISVFNSYENKEKLNSTLVSGVNGVGKTTTIGKIGKIFKDNGSEVLFSACDTFRAAAIEQLEAWSSKVGVPIVKSDPGSDPASVAYKSIEYAKNNNIKRVLIDTAGRLQNKKNLMVFDYSFFFKEINIFSLRKFGSKLELKIFSMLLGIPLEIPV